MDVVCCRSVFQSLIDCTGMTYDEEAIMRILVNTVNVRDDAKMRVRDACNAMTKSNGPLTIVFPELKQYLSHYSKLAGELVMHFVNLGLYDENGAHHYVCESYKSGLLKLKRVDVLYDELCRELTEDTQISA